MVGMLARCLQTTGFGGAPLIVYFYGNTSTSHNPKLYTQQVGHLANAVTERAASNPCGMQVIDNHDW
jgi:hypothetical protein